MSTTPLSVLSGSLLVPTPGRDKIFSSHYNRNSFLLEHKLHQSGLFALPHLAKVADQLAAMPGHLYYNVGKLNIDRRWDIGEERPFSSHEALRRIESADAWMILKRVQVIPEYGELMWNLLREIHQISQRELDSVTHTQNISIIITSPDRITPYHIDADCNYLLQIQGTKTAYVFDGTDREVLTTRELERFYSGDINAAEYRESVQCRATAYALRPGNGIHVPVTFPHWVKNDSNVSVSISMNFCFTDETIPDMYRLNSRLRKLGLNPSRPGTSRVLDAAKTGLTKLLRFGSRRG